MTPALAGAEEELEGNVVAGDTIPVTAPYGGTISSISLREGALISVGDTVATMQTTKVLAPEDGTVRGVFSQEGDTLDKTTVLYIAPVSKYTIACTIEKAYNAIDTKYVKIGETVYINNKRVGTYKAEGIITAVSGSGYTVQTTAGELYMEDTVYIYRDEDYSAESRIGSGTVGRTAELAITGSGSLLKLTWRRRGGRARAASLRDGRGHAGRAGRVRRRDHLRRQRRDREINVTGRAEGLQGDVLLTVYQQDSYQIEFSIDEDLLSVVHVGIRSTSFSTGTRRPQRHPGTVTAFPTSRGLPPPPRAERSDSSETTATKYTGYIAFNPMTP
jgi:hypothetical protein